MIAKRMCASSDFKRPANATSEIVVSSPLSEFSSMSPPSCFPEKCKI